VSGHTENTGNTVHYPEVFNTIEYCKEKEIPCFTFKMDYKKKPNTQWKEITEENFKGRLKSYHNGFAVLTGKYHIVLDWDEKESPPTAIRDTLYRVCNAVEKTPGGYHFWFKATPATSTYQSKSEIYWRGEKVKGFDIRAGGGIVYTAPSYYMKETGEEVRYEWVKGNLSTVDTLPEKIMEIIAEPIAHETLQPEPIREEMKDAASVVETLSVGTVTEDDDIIGILRGLSPSRANSYDDWVRVGMALKNAGYLCEIWDDWSKQSSKYKVGECEKKWATFQATRRPVSIRTLYAMLKADNYDLFMELVGKKNQIQKWLTQRTHASVAQVFFTLNPDKYTYSSITGWYVLQENNTWKELGTTDIAKVPGINMAIMDDCTTVLMEIIGQMRGKTGVDEEKRKQLIDCMRMVSSASFLRGVHIFLRDLYAVDRVEEMFDQQRHLFAFTNCVLDTQTMEFREILPSDYLTVTCGYPYRPIREDEKAIVAKILGDIFPDEDVKRYILQGISLSLSGYNTDEIFHVLTGLGANGKSCLMDLCQVTFGEYCRTLAVTYLTKDDDGKEKPMPDLVDAIKSRFLISTEPEAKDRLQTSIIKQLTGGDGITCRGLYSKAKKYIPQFKLWIMTNDMPRLSKYDKGLERRMRCVHFPTRFVVNPIRENERRRDERLKQKMREEETYRYGMIGLLLDTFRGIKGCLTVPKAVREFTEGYLLENNPVGAWLAKYYEITGDRKDVVGRSDMHRAFLTDMNTTVTIVSFSHDMEKCEIYDKTVKGKHYYWGIKRKEINSDDCMIISGINKIIHDE
jgi:P4 family phage/plasmid primase-like protien